MLRTRISERSRSRVWITLVVLAAGSLSCNVLGLGGERTDSTEPATPAAPITEEAAGSTPAGSERQTTSLPIAEGECANPLLPLEVGNQWTYRQRSSPATAQPSASSTSTPSGGPSFTWTVHDVTDTQAAIRMESPSLGVTAMYTVSCQEGAILTFPTLAMSLSSLPGGAAGTVDLAYTHGGGEFLPSLETFEQNNWDHQWETEILLSGSVTSSPVEGQTFELNFEESPWMMTWSTAGAGEAAFERLSVPAGTFNEALKIRQETSMTVNMSMEGVDLSPSFTSTAHQWYSRGVGLLGTETLTTALNMSGMEFPIPAEEAGTGLELVSFRQVQE